MNYMKQAFCYSILIHIVFLVVLLFLINPNFIKPKNLPLNSFIPVDLIELPVAVHSKDILINPLAASTKTMPFLNINSQRINSQKINHQKMDNHKFFSRKNNSQRISSQKTNFLSNSPVVVKETTKMTQNKSTKSWLTTEQIKDTEPRIKLLVPISYWEQKGGACIFKILVSENGTPLRVELEQSSGDALLDAAIKEALEHSQYFPAIADGKPALGWLKFNYHHWTISVDNN